MHSGSSITPENPAFSISIGISALIIEGRPLYDDEYTNDAADINQRRPNHEFLSTARRYSQALLESPQSPFGE